MLDRLLHRSVVVEITGDSYRMRSHRARAEATRRAVASHCLTRDLRILVTDQGLVGLVPDKAA